MKLNLIPTILFLGAVALAQDIHFNYDRSANFSAYKTYQWVESRTGAVSDQLLDQNIKRAVDAQFALKGMQRVESGGDVTVTYQAAIDREKQFDAFGTGPRFYGSGRVSTTTIEVGKLVVDVSDPARNQIVWRGFASKTLDISKDPEKNYEKLQKAMAKLFKNYPPASGK